jgi:hypothetical protein
MWQVKQRASLVSRPFALHRIVRAMGGISSANRMRGITGSLSSKPLLVSETASFLGELWLLMRMAFFSARSHDSKAALIALSILLLRVRFVRIAQCSAHRRLDHSSETDRSSHIGQGFGFMLPRLFLVEMRILRVLPQEHGK